MIHDRAALAALAFSALSLPAAAQVLEPPERAIRYDAPSAI